MEYPGFMNYREVLVTGGSGFVGTHVCRALISRGFLPRLLVRPGSEERIPPDIRGVCRVTQGDVTDRESVENAVQGTSAVIHLVGIIRQFPERGVTFERMHVTATRNVIEAAKTWTVPRVLHMSALGAAAGGSTAYFDTKGRAEELVRRSGLRWTIFRPSVIFGPGGGFLAEIRKMLRSAPLVPIPGHGRYRMQPVFAGDVAKGFAEALLRPASEGKTFDVCGPDRFTYDELVDLVAAGMGMHARKLHLPVSLLRPAVRGLEWMKRFPLTTDQLQMLLEESIGDHEPFFSAFGFPPFSLTEYLYYRKAA